MKRKQSISAFTAYEDGSHSSTDVAVLKRGNLGANRTFCPGNLNPLGLPPSASSVKRIELLMSRHI